MGFPENFKIIVSDTQAYKQFGNAVIVPLIYDLAKSIKYTLDNNSQIVNDKGYTYLSGETYQKSLF